MFTRFLPKRRLLKGLILFISTVGLAIALAHGLNRTELRSTANPEVPVVPGQSTPPSLQVENKYDRPLAQPVAC
ncbi:MAG: hypothetical protein VKL39_13635 [Leptolyngbyaceae bacterium]|nr:hypothetical protein [Leptolyngbyaceae bacterium]